MFKSLFNLSLWVIVLCIDYLQIITFLKITFNFHFNL